ncbi:MAG: hypothetical protein LBB23_00890 [Rickettsiales bacterium]|jgi:hypothetical protein|nr:hypothetical protein [Rickettsiales bacterium]
MKKILMGLAALAALAGCKDSGKPLQLNCEGKDVKVFFDKTGTPETAVINDKFSVKITDRIPGFPGYVGEVIWGDKGDLTYIWQLVLRNNDDGDWTLLVDTGYTANCVKVNE